MNIEEKEKFVQSILVSDIENLNKLSNKSNFDINAPLISHETFLMHACINSVKHEVLEWLIQKGADINCKNDYGVTPLIVASIHNNLGAVKLLVSYGADLELKYVLSKAKPDLTKTALQLAIEKENVDIAQYLILNKANTENLNLTNSKSDKLIKATIASLKEKEKLENHLNLDKTCEIQAKKKKI